MSVAIFLFVLVILILVHEFGHFIVAKKSGARVDEFGVGFPPKLFGIKKGETEYTLNALPFGGFVKIYGEDATNIEALKGDDYERSFVAQPVYKKAAIIVAGVFFNLLLAWGLFSVGFMAGLPMPSTAAPAGSSIEAIHVTILGVEDGSPAEVIGLLPGDRILSLADESETLAEPTITTVQEFIALREGREFTLTYLRSGNEESAVLVPERGIVGDQPAIGVTLDTIGKVTLPPHRAIWEAGIMTVSLTGAITVAFGNLIVDAVTGEADFSSIAGPVGIVGLVGDAAEFGFVYLLGFTAFISINLAIINLIPFPALDGGRLLFLAIETIKGSPVNPRVASMAHLVGFALLILLMLAVTYNDIVRLIS